ncbi:phage protein NinX family protein [Burkholderia stabilis]|uniref:phage protein NinX family protein n=1 Tax=Burkholderia stabilis TaxID=95485 RepID=UPI001F4AFB8B|nr:phage protein NinX family protein [Burkholderia stabilis]
MKVSELEGALLDYWVARADERPLSSEWDCAGADGILIGTGAGDLERFAPSTDWAHGGPIIDRVPFGIFERVDGGWAAGIYQPQQGMRDLCVAYQAGDTLLIAAMRAYVASKFGDEVPDGEARKNG